MKKKGVRVVVGLVLACLLTGMLGVCSSAGSSGMGLTYRLDSGGGLKIETQSGLGAELLLYYEGYTDEDSRNTYLDLRPSVLYRFKGSSDTSLYVGVGYLFSPDIYNNATSAVYHESGFSLLLGVERSFGKKFSCDLRATAYLNTWENTGSWEEQGTRNGLRIDLGISIYR